MGRKLFVGNLAYQVSDADLEQLFAGFGIVESAQVIQDRDTGRSKGFGFVEMSSEAEAQAAIQGGAIALRWAIWASEARGFRGCWDQ